MGSIPGGPTWQTRAQPSAPTSSTSPSGTPAPGVGVALFRLADDGTPELVGELQTDADGRIADLLDGAGLASGDYQLAFDVGGYADDPDAFFQSAAVALRITDTRSLLPRAAPAQPVRHEHLPRQLTDADRSRSSTRLDADAFASTLAPLFEGAPRFLARLAEARPFETEEDLFGAARATARQMPEEEQIELLDAHPRIGADPAAVSDTVARRAGLRRSRSTTRPGSARSSPR